MERHILREGTSSCLISSSGSQGVSTLAPPCKRYRQKRPNPLIGWVCLVRIPILCTLSKSDCVVLITWSPFGYTHFGPDVLSSCCLLITTWQLVKAHGVTRNEPKIHVICYITKPLTNECPWYATKLHLMVRLQSWSFGESGEPLFCHYSRDHFDPK